MSVYTVTIDGKETEIELGGDGSFRMAGTALSLEVRQLDGRSFSVMLEGSSYKVVAIRSVSGVQVLVNGNQQDVTVQSERALLIRKYDRQKSSARTRMELHAPMPALVVKVEVNVGDEVVQGQGLIVLEAMKMENELKAHQSGRVKEIRVSKGKVVEKGELLMLLE